MIVRRAAGGVGNLEPERTGGACLERSAGSREPQRGCPVPPGHDTSAEGPDVLYDDFGGLGNRATRVVRVEDE